jgi:DNA-binding transcriptional ArsR family regulator
VNIVQIDSEVKGMPSLDEAMLKHIHYLVFKEHRPFSHRDFCSEEAKGQPYAMAHGTFRNKISKFMKLGIVEIEYNSGTTYYTLKDVHFGNRKKSEMMTPKMTPNHMGVSPVTSVIKDITESSLYKEIHSLPPEKRAIHDIHLKFQVPDIWTILASSKKYTPNPVSKDISLPYIIASNHLKIHTIVHRTDIVTVSVACSFAPVVTDTDGLIRLSNALTRVEERTSRIVDECGSILPGGYESIPIPDHSKWVVTLWHFGTDSQNYKELVEDKYCVTWQEGQNVLGRIYSKKKVKGKIKRIEIQERPNKPFADAIRDKIHDSTTGHVCDLISKTNHFENSRG